MAKINQGRLTVENNQDLVVFLIGARINRLWMLPITLMILGAMPRMLRELRKDPSSGFLGFENFGLGGMVQYWRSVEDLTRYARDSSREHQPADTAYFRRLFKSAAAGVWHETFVVKAGQYESIYTNMPALGLGKVFPLVPATGSRRTILGRLGRAAE
jgi:Domain of unknown function (DUF4188)